MFSIALIDILAKVIPIALQVIPLVEKLFAGSSGKEKKDIAIELIKPAVRAAEAALNREVVDEDALSSAADSTVDGIVDILNTVGVFKKTSS